MPACACYNIHMHEHTQTHSQRVHGHTHAHTRSDTLQYICVREHAQTLVIKERYAYMHKYL